MERLRCKLRCVATKPIFKLVLLTLFTGCETTSSEADIASSMTWCNPSLDLGEQSGFSPYVAISSISATNKSEWPSSTAAASFDSNMRFTPRDTGSVQLLGETQSFKVILSSCSHRSVLCSDRRLDGFVSLRSGHLRTIHNVGSQHCLSALPGQRGRRSAASRGLQSPANGGEHWCAQCLREKQCS